MARIRLFSEKIFKAVCVARCKKVCFEAFTSEIENNFDPGFIPVSLLGLDFCLYYLAKVVLDSSTPPNNRINNSTLTLVLQSIERWSYLTNFFLFSSWQLLTYFARYIQDQLQETTDKKIWRDSLLKNYRNLTWKIKAQTHLITILLPI